MDEQKSDFVRQLEKHIDGLVEKSRSAFSISQEKYDQAVAALQLTKGVKCAQGSYFKYWVSQNFKLQKIGARNVLYCLKTSNPVVPQEELFDTIKRCHERVGHAGRDKTWAEVRANYGWVRWDCIPIFLSTCPACTVRVPLKKPPAGRPIISLGFPYPSPDGSD